MIMSPDLAIQATQTSPEIASERPTRLDQFFRPLAGGPNLFDLPEKKWKPWRAVFNKGFSADHLSSLIPGMVEEALKYRDTLKKLALKGDLFQLDPITLRFTMDFIGRTVLLVISQSKLDALFAYMPSGMLLLEPRLAIMPLLTACYIRSHGKCEIAR